MGDQKEDDVKGDSEACVWANVTCSEIKDSRNVCLSLVGGFVFNHGQVSQYHLKTCGCS